MNDNDLRFLNECEMLLRRTTKGPMDLHRIDQNDGTIAYQIQQHSSAIDKDDDGGAVVLTQFDDADNPNAKSDAEFCQRSGEMVHRLIRFVREQDKRARHAELERDAYNARIAELEAEVIRVGESRAEWLRHAREALNVPDAIGIVDLGRSNASRIADLEAEVAKLKPDAEAWRKGHDVIRELRERVIPCGHKVEDLIGREGSVTKCGSCSAAKQAERATFAGSKP
jgi:hypothetical protein